MVAGKMDINGIVRGAVRGTYYVLCLWIPSDGTVAITHLMKGRILGRTEHAGIGKSSNDPRAAVRADTMGIIGVS